MPDLRNEIRLVGNCGKPPVLKFKEPEGTPMTSFRLAVDDKEDGKPITVWWTVELYGRTAERACDLVTKGAQVTVKGKFRLDVWGEPTDRKFSLVVAQADFIVHNKTPADPPA